MTHALSASPHRLRLGRKILFGLSAIAVVAWGLPAQATLVHVTFDGPLFGDPERNWGIGAASVQTAIDASIPLYLVNPAGVGPAVDVGPITIEQDLMSYSTPTTAPVSAHSQWTGESAESFVGSRYFLIFAAVEPTVPDPMDAYKGEQVQLGIDAEDGWVLVQAGSLVFPALLLEGLDSEEDFVFDVHYLINRALPLADYMEDPAYFLPQFRLAGASGSAVIPEPATVALLGFGLLGLAARRRHAL